MSENVREGLKALKLKFDGADTALVEGVEMYLTDEDVDIIFPYLKSQIEQMPLLSKEEVKKRADFVKVLPDLTPIDDDLETSLYTAVLEGAKAQKQDIVALFSEE